ncbi:DNA polymerase-4 [Gracilibacillus ureilyticus]|uniref:DNA polymerase IV n=1 Tax=Gracilibacillus ureilyticus TaxID=531814 RepID=A0A1H9LUT4_9BACI|nr:DNA polymerase IV [Gracilibacillus ureilyticus]SER15211.1 DNA polymerase-4 [Gracilibacillus ureilyticus]
MKSWYPKNGYVILHVDMNCFYASVEIADKPELKGKPVAIAGNPDERKGIIVTCSYEARNFGVKTTMPLWEARKLCPKLVVLRPDFPRYREVSQQIFKLLESYTPYVEPVSIDEAFVDITTCSHLGSPVEIAHSIQKELLVQLNLPSSIGIAPNKFLAKMGSDMKKPNGITILRKRDIQSKLWPLPVEEMYGVGRKSAEKLRKHNINNIGEIANADPQLLKMLLGINGEKLKARASGNDPRPVDPLQAAAFKSIGSSATFPKDILDYDELILQLNDIAYNVAVRLDRKNAVSDAIQIMIRYGNRKTITRRMKLPTYIISKEDIFYYSELLLNQHWNGEAIRLLGITMQDAKRKEDVTYQLSFF